MQRKVFSYEDKLFLKELVISKRHILESRRADGVGLKQKGELWENIREEFNRETGDNRTTAQLRKLWDNMKTLSKKTRASERRERMMTGGGPGPVPQADSTKKNLGDLSEVVIKDIKGACDSDSLYLLHGIKQEKNGDTDAAKINLMAVKEEAVRKECEANLQYLSTKLEMEEREHNKRMELMELERREREQRILLITLEIEEKKALLKKQ